MFGIHMGVCVWLYCCLEIKWHVTKTTLVFHAVEFCFCIKTYEIYNVLFCNFNVWQHMTTWKCLIDGPTLFDLSFHLRDGCRHFINIVHISILFDSGYSLTIPLPRMVADAASCWWLHLHTLTLDDTMLRVPTVCRSQTMHLSVKV